MIVRIAKEKDIKKIAAIMIDSWQKNFKGIVPEEVLNEMNPVKISKNINKLIIDGNIFVAEQEDEVVGFVGVGENRIKKCPNWEAEIQAIHVSYDAKGSGIGTQLLEKALTELKNRKYEVVGLSVFESNPANKFYKKHGGFLVGKHQKNMGEEKLIENLYEFQL